MILIAPYRMDVSWMPELLQLSRYTPIPVYDDRRPLIQTVHRTDIGVENQTYHCLNLHA